MLKVISLPEKWNFINKTIFKAAAQLSKYSLTHYLTKKKVSLVFCDYSKDLGDFNRKFNKKLVFSSENLYFLIYANFVNPGLNIKFF